MEVPMLSRREMITAGLAGGLAAAPGGASALPVEEQEQREVAAQLQAIDRTLNNAFLPSSSIVAKLRSDMEQFLRANGKFPDFIEIGVGVFYDVYDWHIKNRQELLVTVRNDGRYAMQFMFTSLILRSEQDRLYVGVPFNRG
jgi:hypothetical protein